MYRRQMAGIVVKCEVFEEAELEKEVYTGFTEDVVVRIKEEVREAVGEKRSEDIGGVVKRKIKVETCQEMKRARPAYFENVSEEEDGSDSNFSESSEDDDESLDPDFLLDCFQLSCPFQTSNQGDLKEHEKIHTAPFECEKCDFIAGSKRSFNCHKKIHKFECDKCEFATELKRGFNRHMKKKHPKTLQCDKCEYTTLKRRNLTDHKLVHSNNKKFACKKCSYRSVRRDNLKQHEWIHEDKKPYCCTECPYQTVHKSVLKSHVDREHQN